MNVQSLGLASLIFNTQLFNPFTKFFLEGLEYKRYYSFNRVFIYFVILIRGVVFNN